MPDKMVYVLLHRRDNKSFFTAFCQTYEEAMKIRSERTNPSEYFVHPYPVEYESNEKQNENA